MNSVQVFQASNTGVETVTNSFLMHKVFCIRQGDTFVYIFHFSSKESGSTYNKTISELLQNLFV